MLTNSPEMSFMNVTPGAGGVGAHSIGSDEVKEKRRSETTFERRELSAD